MSCVAQWLRRSVFANVEEIVGGCVHVYTHVHMFLFLKFVKQGLNMSYQSEIAL